MIIEVRLDQIQTHPLLQVRSDNVLSVTERDQKESDLQKQHERLLTVIQAGPYIDPIQVIRSTPENSEEFLVFDGHHRLLAYKDLKQPHDIVKVELLDHSLQDAPKLGYTVNATHGAALRDKERTHACFRSLLFCHEEIPTKDLQVHGIGERLAQKLKQAAKILKSEADVYQKDNADQILKKIQAWTRGEIKKHGKGFGSGRPAFITDEHMIPSYRYVLDRKPINVEEPEGVRLARMIEQMKVYVQNDPDLFRKAVKQLSREYDLQIRVKNQKVQRDEDDEREDQREHTRREVLLSDELDI
jgi:hypothetical protein